MATDNHLGVWEKDPVRRDDSFATFEEIFDVAERYDADMVLLGGDLFHEPRPSQHTLTRAIEILRRRAYARPGDPVPAHPRVSVLSSREASFASGSYNGDDPGVNVRLPVFTIHGNHDDPSGERSIGAVDVVSAAGLVNYFGKTPIREGGAGTLRLSPVLLEKGSTRVALYGLGNLRDERACRMFAAPGCVEWRRPADAPGYPRDGWVNLFVLHQNRVQHTQGAKNVVREGHLARFLDLVVWGHEHECMGEPWRSAEAADAFSVLQPGSSVATALSEGESKTKHVVVLDILEDSWRTTLVRLETVRPFAFESLSLADARARQANGLAPRDEPRLDPADPDTVDAYLDYVIGKAVARAARGKSAKAPDLPLVRLRVDHSGFPTVHTQRLGARWVGKVANPQDVVLWRKRAVRGANGEPLAASAPGTASTRLAASAALKGGLGSGTLPVAAAAEAPEEDFIVGALERSLQNELRVLAPGDLAKALRQFVGRDERGALVDAVATALRDAEERADRACPDLAGEGLGDDLEAAQAIRAAALARRKEEEEEEERKRAEEDKALARGKKEGTGARGAGRGREAEGTRKRPAGASAEPSEADAAGDAPTGGSAISSSDEDEIEVESPRAAKRAASLAARRARLPGTLLPAGKKTERIVAKRRAGTDEDTELQGWMDPIARDEADADDAADPGGSGAVEVRGMVVDVPLVGEGRRGEGGGGAGATPRPHADVRGFTPAHARSQASHAATPSGAASRGSAEENATGVVGRASGRRSSIGREGDQGQGKRPLAPLPASSLLTTVRDASVAPSARTSGHVAARPTRAASPSSPASSASPVSSCSASSESSSASSASSDGAAEVVVSSARKSGATASARASQSGGKDDALRPSARSKAKSPAPSPSPDSPSSAPPRRRAPCSPPSPASPPSPSFSPPPRASGPQPTGGTPRTRSQSQPSGDEPIEIGSSSSDDEGGGGLLAALFGPSQGASQRSGGKAAGSKPSAAKKPGAKQPSRGLSQGASQSKVPSQGLSQAKLPAQGLSQGSSQTKATRQTKLSLSLKRPRADAGKAKRGGEAETDEGPKRAQKKGRDLPPLPAPPRKAGAAAPPSPPSPSSSSSIEASPPRARARLARSRGETSPAGDKAKQGGSEPRPAHRPEQKTPRSAKRGAPRRRAASPAPLSSPLRCEASPVSSSGGDDVLAASPLPAIGRTPVVPCSAAEWAGAGASDSGCKPGALPYSYVASDDEDDAGDAGQEGGQPGRLANTLAPSGWGSAL